MDGVKATIDSFPENHFLRRVLYGDIPDTSLVIPPSLAVGLTPAIDQWQYVRHWFAEGRRDRAFRPPLMPCIWTYCILTGRVQPFCNVCALIEPFASVD